MKSCCAALHLGLLLLCQAADASAPADQTALLQQAIDALPPGGILDCQGASYVVSSLLLKSNMTMQNCSLTTLPGALDFASPVTIDGRGQPVANVTLRRVQVFGDRHEQTNIGYAGQEDGGRHCFRILGRVSGLVIEDSSGSYCATDGIAFVSWGVSTSDNPADLPFQNIAVRNSQFSFNRRSGISADGMNNATFDHVSFLNNGTTVAGGLAEGDLCASSPGPASGAAQCYGSGFWYEDYRTGVAGEGLSDVLFSGCVFRNNFQRSLFFITHEQPSAPNYQPRSNIRIVDSSLDAGLQPLAEDYAVQFQVDAPLAGAGALYQNIAIQNTQLSGSLGLHQAANVSVISSAIDTPLASLGYAAGITNISFRDVQPSGKTLAAALDPAGGPAPVVTYSNTPAVTSAASPPQSGTNGKGDVVWNSAASAPSGWICLSAGTPCAQWLDF